MLTPAPQGFRGAHYHSVDWRNSGAVTQSIVTQAAAAYPAANLAIYLPLRVRYPCVVKKLWVATGATAAGNFDLGVYDAAGVRLVSAGSTAMAASTEVVVDVTDTTISPGIYYIALSNSTNTDSFPADAPAAPNCAAMGILSESLGSVTLPATATWAVDQTLAFAPVAGMLLETTVA